jgi:hypothetical protein
VRKERAFTMVAKRVGGALASPAPLTAQRFQLESNDKLRQCCN